MIDCCEKVQATASALALAVAEACPSWTLVGIVVVAAAVVVWLPDSMLNCELAAVVAAAAAAAADSAVVAAVAANEHSGAVAKRYREAAVVASPAANYVVVGCVHCQNEKHRCSAADQKDLAADHQMGSETRRRQNHLALDRTRLAGLQRCCGRTPAAAAAAADRAAAVVLRPVAEESRFGRWT